jgi:CHASE3 domain sensor protein
MLSDEKKREFKKLVALLVLAIFVFMVMVFVVISRHS